MKIIILMTAVGGLFMPYAQLHAQDTQTSDATDQVAVQEKPDLTVLADDANNVNIQHDFNFGVMSDEVNTLSNNSTTAADDFWTRDKILGDMWGARTGLGDIGFKLDLRLSQFYQGVVEGGLSTGSEYGAVLDSMLMVDGHKLGLWEGFYVNMHVTTQWGNILSDAGPFALPNTAMLYPLPGYDGVAVTGLYAMQMLSPNFGLVAGKLNSVDLQTMIFPNVGGGVEGFMNTNALAPGMPFFRWVNLSELGAGALVMADDGQVQGGLLVIDTQNATTNSGFDNFFDNGAGILGIWRFFFEMDGKPGSIVLAGGGATGDYDSLAPSDWDFIPGLGLVGKENSGVWTVAAYYQQIFWEDPGNKARNVMFWTGAGVSDGNPSFSKFDIFATIEANGLLFGRDQDRAGIGVFYTEPSHDFKDLTSTLAGVELQDVWGVEAYYNYEVTPWFHLTGDIQVVQSALRDADSAVILGVRGVLDF